MPIIKLVNFALADGTNFRVVHQNPQRAYREILMRDNNGLPVPYQVYLAQNDAVVVGIPHGLSTMTGHPVLPDVVIPIAVWTPDVTIWSHADFVIVLDPNRVISPTGAWADETYVYIGVAMRGAQAAWIRFVVYVEWTHSLIENEVITGNYYYAYTIG